MLLQNLIIVLKLQLDLLHLIILDHLIKSLIDNNIIDKGGGHNMAAGFTMKKNNIKLLDNFIQKDYLKKYSD